LIAPEESLVLVDKTGHTAIGLTRSVQRPLPEVKEIRLGHACAMALHYLDFDFSDEDSGRGSFDAMACVVPSRFPALLAEISAVLRWACRTFGPAGALQDDGEWDYQLEGTIEPDAPLEVTYDESTGEVSLAPAPIGQTLTTLVLTLSGSSAFCEALREEFGAGS
jgi:hypothetical protein